MAGAVPNSYRTGQLKSKMLNLAQTSVYQVKVQPPPRVVAFMNSRGVAYNTDGDNLELLCSETTLPGTSLTTTEVTNDYHGVTEKMAYRRMFDATVDMSFYVDKDYKIVEFFESWIDFISGMNINNPNGSDTREMYRSNAVNYRMNYPTTYKGPIYITKFEKNLSDQQMSYEFVDAFPLNLISMPVSYGQSEVLKFNVSFAYTRYIRFRSNSGLLKNYGQFFRPPGPPVS